MNFYYRTHLDISINQQGAAKDSKESGNGKPQEEGDWVDSNPEAAVLLRKKPS
jgi:hypothetical protein